MQGENDILISVVMPVYNTKKTQLEESVSSILAQSYKNLEFIIIDDASDYETRDYLSSLRDTRIVIIHNTENKGVTFSLNEGLKRAKGKYIARMDADDVSMIYRLEHQLQFMEKHKDVVVCGGLASINGGNEIIGASFIKDRETRKIRLSLYNEGIVHPTAFIRADAIRGILYDELISKAQDYELWTRLIDKGKIEVIPEVVLMYRVHELQISAKGKADQDACKVYTQKKMLRRLGEFSEKEIELYLDFANYVGSYNIRSYLSLIEKLCNRNHEYQVYKEWNYKKELMLHLYLLVKTNRIQTSMLEKLCFCSPLTIGYFIREKVTQDKKQILLRRISKTVVRNEHLQDN